MSLLMSTIRRRSGSALAPAFTSSPIISGTYAIGEVLTCAPGTWTGTEPVTPTYQWRRSGAAIGGATASAYTLVSADMLATVTCTVTITNGAGVAVITSAGLSWADYIATLSPRVWLDAQNGTYLTRTGALIDTAIDRSGSGYSAAMTGTARPSYDATRFGGRGGMVFGGAQSLVTPAFLCPAGTSGSVVWAPTATAQAAFEFGPLNSHVLGFIESGQARVRAAGAGDAASAAVFAKTRMTWRSSPTAITRVLFDGVVVSSGSPAASAVARTAVLRIGALDGGFYPLIGAIGELVFATAEWTDAQMAAADAAMAARWA